MRKHFAFGLAILAAAALTGCNDITEPPPEPVAEQPRPTPSARAGAANRGRALVRFVNADPTKGDLDLWRGESSPFTRVAYQMATPYLELPITGGQFRVTDAGSDRRLTSLSADLWNGRRYSVVASAGAGGTTNLLVINDDFAAPATGRAKIRIVHAAPQAGSLEVRTGRRKDDPLFVLQFPQASGYKEVNPVTTKLSVVRQDNAAPAPELQLKDLELRPDHIYTIFLTGAPGSLDFFYLENQLSGPMPRPPLASR